MWSVVLVSLGGALIACVAACIPGLHILNVLAILGTVCAGMAIEPALALSFTGSALVAYAMVNSVPSVLLSAPDESAVFTVLPGQAYLLRGRGYEAVMLTAVGGLIGLCAVLFSGWLFLRRIVPLFHAVLRPHWHWIIWCVIAFMLLSEWPRDSRRGQGGWRKLGRAWTPLLMGLLTFVLAGMLGVLLFYRNPVDIGVAFQGLMPALVGLFTVPWLVLNSLSCTDVPPQSTRIAAGPLNGALAHGALAGMLGGGFAALCPAVTGGVGGFLAGHASAVRDDRTFLVSQGAAKVVYYACGFLMMFIPFCGITRGGAGWMVRAHVPFVAGGSSYMLVLASFAIAGVVSCLLISPLARIMLRLIGRFGIRTPSVVALCIVVLAVAALTGAGGFLVLTAGTLIGLLPVLFGARRMNGLAVVLLPVALNMSGAGGWITGLMNVL